MVSSCVQKSKYDELSKKYEELKTSMQKSTSQLYVQNSFVDSLCQTRDIDPNVGSRIPWQLAKDKLAEYKKKMRELDPNYDPKNDIYGYTIGLKTIKDLMDDIEIYNIFYGENDPRRITGLRVYKAWTMGKDPYQEVFLIPVVKNKGLNIYNVDPDYTKSSDSDYDELEMGWNQFVSEKGAELTSIDPILNTSKPCPNLCD